MTLDATARALATKLLAQFGRPVIVTIVNQGSYNTLTGQGNQNSTSYTVNALIEENKGYLIDKDLSQIGDKKITICGADIPIRPKPVDTVNIDGIIYRVVSVKAVSSGLLNALYEIQVRLT